jgi:site-specific recombinase XerD
MFVSKREAPFTVAGFGRMVERAGKAAGLPFKCHAHMLRHSCGFALANANHPTRSIQSYMGHRSIASTVIYTALTSSAFRDFWK